FSEKDYENAIKYYSEALELNPSNAIYYSNRSLAYLRTECYGYALADATKALEIDKNYIKGYYRRATSNMALGKFKAALKDYETVVRVRPNDKDARMKYQECNKIVKQKAFERAIASDETKKSVVDSLDIENMTIEDDYAGPKLENGKVTLAFMKEMMEWFKDQKKLHRKCAYQILVQVKDVLSKLPSLIEITLKEVKKITICGDTHGQYYDLLNIFKLNGLPSETNPYLFNGDFVDRGSFSLEVILTLFGFKLLYPDNFHLLRGNHETDNMNQMYGFEGEVKAKYTAQMFQLFSEVFQWLPLAQCINNKVLVMHGGLFSEDGVTLEDLRKIDRNRQPPDSGPMCDLLWSDPQPQNGRSISKRGVSCQFGPDVTERFLSQNKLDFIVRSHEVKAEGYEVTHSGKCITVFSAPNYCDQMGNKGAYIHLRGSDLKPEFHQFTAVASTTRHDLTTVHEFAFTLFLIQLVTGGDHRRQMPKHCSVPNCKNGSGPGTDKKSFYKFPLQDADRLQQWLTNMGRGNWTPSRYHYICHEHFSPECIKMRWGIRYLENDAVPTIFQKTPKSTVADCSEESKQPLAVGGKSETVLLDGSFAADPVEMLHTVSLYEITVAPSQQEEPDSVVFQKDVCDGAGSSEVVLVSGCLSGGDQEQLMAALLTQGHQLVVEEPAPGCRDEAVASLYVEELSHATERLSDVQEGHAAPEGQEIITYFETIPNILPSDVFAQWTFPPDTVLSSALSSKPITSTLPIVSTHVPPSPKPAVLKVDRLDREEGDDGQSEEDSMDWQDQQLEEHCYHKSSLSKEQLEVIVLGLQKKVKMLQQRHRRHLEKLVGLENTVSQLRQNNLLNEERLQLLERVKGPTMITDVEIISASMGSKIV
ncbi:unnamed protein product, partial [Tetraodon nigroviridis]